MMNFLSLSAVVCMAVFASITLTPVSKAAEIPYPPCFTVPELIPISPDGSIPCTITVIQCGVGPVVGSVVTLEFSPEVDALIAWPQGQDHPFFVGTTDANGEATFNIAGAGCIDSSRFTPTTFIALVKADGILLAAPMVNSPDAVNTQGLLPPELGTNICENGESMIGLSDAVFFTRPIKLGLVEPCAKFAGPADEPVHLGDAVIITPFMAEGASFVCQ